MSILIFFLQIKPGQEWNVFYQKQKKKKKKKKKKNLKSDLIFVQSLKMISVCKTAIENQVFYHFKSISLTT